MKPAIKTKRFVNCPNGCAHEFSVEHLFEMGAQGHGRAGPWYCEECGQGWHFAFDANEITVVIESDGGAGNRHFGHDGKMRRQWVVLELPPQKSAVRFIVRGMRFRADIDEDAARYFYEEHTCAVNWLGEVDEVVIDGEPDPHGLWKVVSVSDAKPGTTSS